jgi:hypothetical protein
LFEHQPDLISRASYNVKSSVPIGVFPVFVTALKKGRKVPLTEENVDPISVLAKEFSAEEVLSECAANFSSR